MPPTGGSPDWRIPSVAQCFTPQRVPSVTEHARDFLRRSLCAAYGAEFFLYEKMGRRAIVHEKSTSEAEAAILPPITPKRWESKGTRPRCAASGAAQRRETESRGLALRL